MNEYEVFASYEYIPDLKSGTIMKMTNCKFSHVGIIENGEHIFHATGEGFHQEELHKFCLVHGFSHRFPVYVPDPDFAAGWLRGNVGKDYSESQLIGIGIGMLSKILPDKLIKFMKAKLGDGKRELVCHESVLRFGLECCELPYTGDPDYETPESAIEIMQAVRRKE